MTSLNSVTWTAASFPKHKRIANIIILSFRKKAVLSNAGNISPTTTHLFSITLHPYIYWFLVGSSKISIWWRKVFERIWEYTPMTSLYLLHLFHLPINITANHTTRENRRDHTFPLESEKNYYSHTTVYHHHPSILHYVYFYSKAFLYCLEFKGRTYPNEEKTD